MACNRFSQPQWRPRIAFFNLGVAHSLISSVLLGGTLFGPGVESIAVASSLAQTGHFANPFLSLATGATAHLAPLYPAFLAVFFRCFGTIDSAFIPIDIAVSLLFGILASSVPEIGQVIFHRRLIGFVAAFLLLGFPVIQSSLAWESVPMALCLLCFCLWTATEQRRCWLPGLFAALACLLNPVSFLFLGTWSAGLLLRRNWRFFPLARVWLLCVSIFLPWMLRNYLVLGSFCLRDNFGLELQVHNNDVASPLFLDSAPALQRYHPSLNRFQAVQLAALTEPEYNRGKLAIAVNWISTHPARFVVLTIQRVFYFWFPDVRSGPFAPAVWLLTALSVPSMIRALGKKDLRQLLAVSALAYSLPYTLVSAELRYRTPVLWITALFAAETCYLLLRRAHFLRRFFARVCRLFWTTNGRRHPGSLAHSRRDQSVFPDTFA